MHIETKIDEENNIRFHKLTGPVIFEQFTEWLLEMYRAKDKRLDMNVIWDLSTADFTHISLHDIDDFIDMVSKTWHTNSSKKAALLVSDNLGVSLSKMYKEGIEKITNNRIQIFNDPLKAIEWLS